MTDDVLRRALRLADAAPGDETVQAEAVAACRRADFLPPARILARTSRWRPVARDVARWFERPLEDHDAAGGEAIAAAIERTGGMPWVLREWFALSGARRLDGAGPIQGRRLHELEVDEALGAPLMVLFTEAGTSVRIGVRPDAHEDEDPPVFVSGDDGLLRPVGESLSRFLHHTTVGLGAFWSRKSYDHGVWGRAPLPAIEAAWPRLPFPMLTTEWADTGHLLFGDDDALVQWHTAGSMKLIAQDALALESARRRLPGAEWS